jgi:hypothetical protein
MASPPEDRQGDVWVLDTETKGTGANMVPLERVLKRGSDRVPGFPLPPRQPPPAPAPAPKQLRFKIVDLMTRQALADDVDARRAVEVLEGVRSVVDVTIYARSDPGQAWTRLSFGEAKALWELRHRLSEF